MKKVLLKLIATTLAIFVLLATFSFTVGKHFCGDFLIDISFVGETDCCEMDHSKEVKTKCCKDEITALEGIEILQQHSEKDLAFKSQQFFIAFFHSFVVDFESYKPKKHFLKDFSPPDNSKNFQVSFQCFLI